MFIVIKKAKGKLFTHDCMIFFIVHISNNSSKKK